MGKGSGGGKGGVGSRRTITRDARARAFEDKVRAGDGPFEQAIAIAPEGFDIPGAGQAVEYIGSKTSVSPSNAPFLEVSHFHPRDAVFSLSDRAVEFMLSNAQASARAFYADGRFIEIRNPAVDGKKIPPYGSIERGMMRNDSTYLSGRFTMTFRSRWMAAKAGLDQSAPDYATKWGKAYHDAIVSTLRSLRIPYQEGRSG